MRRRDARGPGPGFVALARPSEASRRRGPNRARRRRFRITTARAIGLRRNGNYSKNSGRCPALRVPFHQLSGLPRESAKPRHQGPPPVGEVSPKGRRRSDRMMASARIDDPKSPPPIAARSPPPQGEDLGRAVRRGKCSPPSKTGARGARFSKDRTVRPLHPQRHQHVFHAGSVGSTTRVGEAGSAKRNSAIGPPIWPQTSSR